jgi:hypothetical protein
LAENKSIWFIDRANKYWYFELEKSGKLWWRYEFFTDFFILFCLEINEFQPLLSEWVEGVLNSGVNTTFELNHPIFALVEGVLNRGYRKGSRKVDEVLNHKVVTTEYCGIIPSYDLEEVLNCEIKEIDGGELFENGTVEKILNVEINETIGTTIREPNQVIEAMNHQVLSISPPNKGINFVQQILVNELIYEVESADPLDTPAHDSVEEVLSYKVNRTIPDLSESLVDVERLLESNQ